MSHILIVNLLLFLFFMYSLSEKKVLGNLISLDRNKSQTFDHLFEEISLQNSEHNTFTQ